MAVCVALEALKFAGSDVVVYSDSKYVVDAVTKGWVFGWEKKGSPERRIPICGDFSAYTVTACVSFG